MEMMDDIDYYKLYQNGEIKEDDLPGEIWCDLVYKEARDYCYLNGINSNEIEHNDLEQCAVTVAASLGFNEEDVLIQLENYWNCFE